MPGLSVVIITFNEEKNIRRCLESVRGIGDEILVIDSGSKDATVDISRSLGATVIQQDFLGYIEQKNFATAKAKNDWVLSLDADEALSPELKKEIAYAITAPKSNGYTMNRLTNYCGTWVRHSSWYPDKKLRLYLRTAGAWTGINPHDRYDLNDGSAPLHLNGDLLHYSYDTLSAHIRQIDHFSTIGAKALYEKGKRSGILKLFYKPLARFIRIYFLKSGFRDGMTGLTIAINSAYAVFLKYLRLYYLQKGKSL